MPSLPALPVLVIVPGASQSPAVFGMVFALLQQRGYPVISALLPTTGTTSRATVDDDTSYIREHMILPVLDIEKHDVVLVAHSYSGLPGGAAACGLSKPQRTAEGHSTGIVGQIHIASILCKGGDGKDVVATFGGQLPPHMRADVRPMDKRGID